MAKSDFYHKFSQTKEEPRQNEPIDWGGLGLILLVLFVLACFLSAIYFVRPRQDRQDAAAAQTLARRTLVSAKTGAGLLISAESRLHARYGRYSGRASELTVIEPKLVRIFGTADNSNGIQAPDNAISYKPIFGGRGYQMTLSFENDDMTRSWDCSIIKGPQPKARVHCSATGEGSYTDQTVSRGWELTAR